MAIDNDVIDIQIVLDGASVGKQSFGKPLCLVALASGDWAVTDIDAPGKKITVSGNHESELTVGQKIRFYGSAVSGRNGQYTVTVKADVLATTEITVSETLLAGAADGGITTFGGGNLYKAYTTPGAVSLDVAYFGAGPPDEAVKIAKAFSQRPRPKTIVVGVIGSEHASPYAALAELFVDYKDFWGFVIKDWSAETDLVSAAPDTSSCAAWAEANGRVFFGQSSDATILAAAYNAGAPADVPSLARVQSLERSLLFYHPDDDDLVAWGLLCNRAGFSPDQYATIFKFVTVSGASAQQYSDTHKTFMGGKYCNFYDTFGGVGATTPGWNGKGQFFDLVLTADWLRARVKETLIQVFLNMTAVGEKIPYDDGGFAQLGNEVENVLERGENIGHLAAGTSAVDMPLLADIDSNTRLTRVLSFSFGSQPSGGVQGLVIRGAVSVDFEGNPDATS